MLSLRPPVTYRALYRSLPSASVLKAITNLAVRRFASSGRSSVFNTVNVPLPTRLENSGLIASFIRSFCARGSDASITSVA